MNRKSGSPISILSAELKKTAAAFLPALLLCLMSLPASAARGPVSGNPPPPRSAAGLQQLLDKAKPGDTVIIPEGIYKLNDRPIRPHVSGNAHAWITIMPGKGKQVIIDGSNYLSRYSGGKQPLSALVLFKNCRYIRMKGIEVRNSHDAGIVMQGPNTDHIEIIRCKSDGSYNSGISMWYADSCRILQCEVVAANNKDLKPEGAPFRGEAPHEAISLAGATHFEVAYNRVHDCFKEGIDCKEVSRNGIIHHNVVYNMPRQGLYTDCWFGRLSGIRFYDNTVYNCEWGFAISGEGRNASMDSIYFHHNLLYNNRASGIFISVWGFDEPRKDIFIYNNTVYHNGTAGHWSGLTGGIDIMSSHTRNLYIYNNIISDNYGYAVGLWAPDAAKDSLLKNRNIRILDNLEWQQNKPGTKNPKAIFKPMYPIELSSDIKADPRFVDAAAGNFRLSASSPARKKGWSAAPTGKADFLGALAPAK